MESTSGKVEPISAVNQQAASLKPTAENYETESQTTLERSAGAALPTIVESKNGMSRKGRSAKQQPQSQSSDNSQTHSSKGRKSSNQQFKRSNQNKSKGASFNQETSNLNQVSFA